jgi:ABC-2 type transport system ATP-binding protein
VVALDGVSFEVGPGEIFGLLGPNGAGKTTSIRVLVTLLVPQAGEAVVFGLDVRSQAMAVRRLLGYVPQQLSAEGALSGFDNVMLFARLYDVPRRERRDRVEEALALMNLEEPARRRVNTYSGGMVRRLELPRRSSTVPGSSCSTNPRWDWTPWRAPTCGSAYGRCGRRPG